jgi:DNA-binding winged helix-turn-helix (wHTH) protein
MKNQGAPMTHAKLLGAVWGPEYGGELEYLRSYVRMLRKKIEDDPAQPFYLMTEPWVGYRFNNPADSGSPPSAVAGRRIGSPAERTENQVPPYHAWSLCLFYDFPPE